MGTKSDVGDYVFSLLDLGPEQLSFDWFHRLAALVTPGGRLIIGSYGSGSRRVAPSDVAVHLEECGFHVAGSAFGGEPPISVFAWADV